MDQQALYQRPREKLHSSGISSLSLAELLQLVIGSGNAEMSAAKFAHAVENLLLEDELTYSSLVQLKGVGDAKACQVIATIEIAKRLYAHEQ